MSDHDHITAIRLAHEALSAAVKAAQDDGLAVKATLAENYYGPWALQLVIFRQVIYAETDGRIWHEAKPQAPYDNLQGSQ